MCAARAFMMSSAVMLGKRPGGIGAKVGAAAGLRTIVLRTVVLRTVTVTGCGLLTEGVTVAATGVLLVALIEPGAVGAMLVSGTVTVMVRCGVMTIGLATFATTGLAVCFTAG